MKRNDYWQLKTTKCLSLNPVPRSLGIPDSIGRTMLTSGSISGCVCWSEDTDGHIKCPPNINSRARKDR